MGRYDGKEEERTLLLTPPELNWKSKGGRRWIVEGFSHAVDGFSRAVTRERKWIRAQRMGGEGFPRRGRGRRGLRAADPKTLEE